MKRLLLLTFMTLFVVSCSGGTFFVSGKSGEKLPKFTLQQLDGKKLSSSTLIDKKKMTIISIQAEWCPHCRKEAPEVQRLYDEFKNSVNVIVVYTNNSSSEEKVKEFVSSNGYTYPSYYDADGKITSGFNVEGFPFNMILDGDKVVKVIEGEMTYDDLKLNLIK